MALPGEEVIGDWEISGGHGTKFPSRCHAQEKVF